MATASLAVGLNRLSADSVFWTKRAHIRWCASGVCLNRLSADSVFWTRGQKRGKNDEGNQASLNRLSADSVFWTPTEKTEQAA